VFHHQERWDGTGYPQQLSGDDIPLGARIIAAADAYHAIRSDRPYRTGRSHREAMRELRRCSGEQFDPRVVEALLAVLDTDAELRALAPADHENGSVKSQAATGAGSASGTVSSGAAPATKPVAVRRGA
jgi:HD-GYP domain-containing protein (c-di-GMP phosphodiesterase class II)